jgi:hypothetical protein
MQEKEKDNLLEGSEHNTKLTVGWNHGKSFTWNCTFAEKFGGQKDLSHCVI